MATPSINSVPADLVLEIMARLPVKSLMRLRFISKSFFSITASPFFITSHLALSKSSGYVALTSGLSNPCPPSITILDKFFFEVLRPAIPFSFSPRSNSARFEGIYFLVGSCNGLLCVTDKRKNYFGRVVVLWNPMIGKFKSISDTSLDSNMLRNTRTRITLGFGYDEKKDDYKIIRIVIPPHKTESSAQAEIYSLKTNSWKRVIFPINYLNKILFFEDRCSFVHGAMHWLVYVRGEINARNNRVIFSFKIDDEQFKVIRLPPNYIRGTNSYCSIELMVLKESLALTIFCDDMEDEATERFYSLWKMKKYEEVESWTKQILPLTEDSLIYGFTKDGELMYSKNDYEVNIYNLDSGAMKVPFMVDAEDVVLFSGESCFIVNFI